MGQSKNLDSQRGDSIRSFDRWERLGRWYSSPLLRRLAPTALRSALRSLGAPLMAPYAARHLPRDREFTQSPEDALASAPLSIIVPIHDAPQVTKRCLASLQKFAPKAEIILVDDGSKLRETETLLGEFSDRYGWKLLRHAKALGHSAASAAGALLATRPHLCLLNSDTVVTPWCWRPIVQAFEQNPEIGVAGPSTSSGDPQTLPFAVLTRCYLNDSQICAFAQRVLAEGSNTIPRDLPWVSGFAFFIRRGLWERLDGFDRNLVDYGNELDLCIRVRRAGYRTVWVRNSYIHHLGAESYGKVIGRESIDARIRSALEYTKVKHSNCDL